MLRCLFIFFLCSNVLSAQNDTIHPNRLRKVILGETVLYVGSMVGLNQLWYKDYPRSSFHFINDNNAWLQMDKIGHAMTSYYVGKVGYDLLKWSGVNEKKSIWYGATLGTLFLTSVEVLDGFSAEWGASPGDLLANAAGSAIFIGQQMAWKEQRVLLKYSFQRTKYAPLRPSLLGENFIQSSLKDYNGQTYWLSANIAAFLPSNTGIPKWLNVAVGYGADGMLGATKNELYPHVQRQRQYYFSLDVDLTRIKTKYKLVNTLLGAVGFIKFPFPTVVFRENDGIAIKPLYF